MIAFWQCTRMFLVVIISMILAVPFSLLSNRYILHPMFAIMGANVKVQVNWLQAYITYPGALLFTILLGTMIACIKIKSINIRELNNLE